MGSLCKVSRNTASHHTSLAPRRDGQHLLTGAIWYKITMGTTLPLLTFRGCALQLFYVFMVHLGRGFPEIMA